MSTYTDMGDAHRAGGHQGPAIEPEMSASSDGSALHRRRLLVVSHPSVVAVNQAVYLAMKGLGWNVRVIVPHRWQHDYASQPFAAETMPGMEAAIVPVNVLLKGRPQRHFYVGRLTRLAKSFRPDMIFLEQESFACAALQWGSIARRLGVPFGVQSDENLDRNYPLPAKLIRRWVLDRAAFVAARSPTAAARVQQWGGKGRIAVVPHAVPLWDYAPDARGDTFTVGFAGRLVPEKGIRDLVAATALLKEPARLLLVGDGPLRREVEAMQPPGVRIEVRSDVKHERMPDAYAEMDVLVLPSRTTATWAEQFGRVLVEALLCGVPVVGSDSGEIPWVVTTTGGGYVFREGDVSHLAEILEDLRARPGERARLAQQGRAVVRERFTADACALAMVELLDS